MSTLAPNKQATRSLDNILDAIAPIYAGKAPEAPKPHHISSERD